MKLPRLRTWYKVHKWISIFTGSALIAWLLSGILMVSQGLIPGLNPAVKARPGEPADFSQVVLSPADVIASVDMASGVNTQVSGIWLTIVGDTLVYAVQTEHDSVRFVNAHTGVFAAITEDFAKQLAQDRYEINGDITSVELLESHDLAYLYGPLPVYRLTFDDAQRTFVHLSAETGSLSANNGIGRLFAAIESLHTFAFLRLFTGDNERLITVLLWGSIITTLSAAIVGYYLALPRRRGAGQSP